SARVAGRFVARLSSYFFEFNLIERNIYYCILAGFNNDILERLISGNGKLAVVLVFIKLRHLRRRDSQTIGSGVQTYRVAAVGVAAHVFPFTANLVSNNDSHVWRRST